MDTRIFMLKHELTGGRYVGGGFIEFTPVVTNLEERFEMEEDLKALNIPYRNDFCDCPEHPDFNKAILIFTLWVEDKSIKA